MSKNHVRFTTSNSPIGSSGRINIRVGDDIENSGDIKLKARSRKTNRGDGIYIRAGSAEGSAASSGSILSLIHI